MNADQFSIEPIELGRRTADTSLFLYLTDPGTPIAIAYRVWVLRSATRTLLVDTGPPLQEAKRRGLTHVIDVVAALANAGIDANQVDTILLTHLHWDHAANADRFPKATFYAQRREIEFFRSHSRQHPAIDRFFSHQAYLASLIDNGRIREIDGDVTLPGGLEALKVGGHTPGSQMFCVPTPAGEAIITGDAIPLHRNYLERIPSGILTDVFEAVAALEQVALRRPALIYTGHDVESHLRL
ncbi:N-acyl homoserine lactonase family protein [Pandoraea sp.]|uniref:N-acyl homoserine lactonase family protein n=1 Tax=Pandoraea sp. TaxID=1883445 RepID=UPI001207FFCA|nr:N-acyl homoserine lactonase family protein [Pandoraea sp.]TAL56447.1 MAG: N-acyl homoserine lactonase family protein [Pandoraea sp.]TAM15266.1 MAG: N-acyl homoserine lactonase family protein [Pandoraea sp.]